MMTTMQRNEFWAEKMTAWKASGLSGQAFCQRHDLVYHQFTYWRRKLQDERREQPQQATGFARVVSAGAKAAGGGLTVSLPSGLSISGIDAGNIDLVGTILRQL